MKALVRELEVILREIDAKTSQLKAATGLACRAGCGACCQSPTVETTVIDMLVLAAWLLETGRAAVVYDQLDRDNRACVFYEANPNDPSFGRCSVYEYRPSICRLFGFAARRNKLGAPELVTCRWQNSEFPETVKKTKEAVATGEVEAPLFGDYAVRIRTLLPGSGHDLPLPINLALKQAIEKLWMIYQVSELVEVSDIDRSDEPPLVRPPSVRLS